MIKINKQKKNGYTVLELLFYIAFFVILTIVVINAMITMARSFKETAIQAELTQTGTIMERISREVRMASGISSIAATDLKLNTTSGADTTMEFKLVGSNLQLLENNVFTGNLNTPNITITGLTFAQISTTKGAAVKILLSVKSNNDTSGRIIDFYDTVVLRNSY